MADPLFDATRGDPLFQEPIPPIYAPRIRGRQGVKTAMTFLCLKCDEQMRFKERDVPGDGTFAAAFACPRCGWKIAMLANPIETQLVRSLGEKIGGRPLNEQLEQPLGLVRSTLLGREDAFEEERVQSGAGGRLRRPTWSAEARDRLARVPKFARGMVKRIYTDYAVERGITEITPEVMNRARSDLGLEEM